MCMSAQSKNSVKFSYIYCVQTSIPSPRYLWPAFEMQVSLESSNWKFPCWIEDGWWNTQRVTTPTNAVSGQSQNCSGNLEISPGIGTSGNFSGKHAIIPGHCRKKENLFHASQKFGSMAQQRLLELSPPVNTSNLVPEASHLQIIAKADITKIN